MLNTYSRVVLQSDQLGDQHAKRGMIGYVIEVHPDGNYEVEFTDPASGVSIAQIVVSEPSSKRFAAP